ncbi:hypothetical protein HPP92_002876 [Vanilla planifolia]|uniref:Uncharacterized protein n=1 Tax=Vanilla planifolia TaxID=51239 RepID=A0A835S298_VANPL|nr:hypothetical protein HPP92_002876 [Vanilla planifolia]
MVKLSTEEMGYSKNLSWNMAQASSGTFSGSFDSYGNWAPNLMGCGHRTVPARNRRIFTLAGCHEFSIGSGYSGKNLFYWVSWTNSWLLRVVCGNRSSDGTEP